MMPLNLVPVSVWDDRYSSSSSIGVASDVFIEAAVQSNHEILRHNFRDLQVKPCRNCGGCFLKEVPCAYLDDFNVVAPDLLRSDILVVFAQKNLSPNLVAAFSKCFCFRSAPKPFALKKAILVYRGPEAEFEKDRVAWDQALESLKPEKQEVYRLDALGASEILFLHSLGEKL